MKKKVPSSINRLAVLALGILVIFSAPVKAEGIFIQDYLPKEWKDKIKVSVESRYRLEAKDDFDFNQRADDTDTFHLLRMRLNLDAAISDDLRGFLQLQDSRIFDSTSANRFSTSFRDEMDIRQAYLDIKNLFKGLTIRGAARSFFTATRG